ncbi:MAG: recombination-associated protein RdgC [Pseudomonadota bacterium]|nr:recombination-associated protein RdgC [Pseudomonadota bacterium]
MWFKNLIVYRLPEDWSVSATELEEKLAARSLMPCGAFDMQSKGWVFSSDLERYVHTVNGQHLIALGVDQKLLPGSIIRQVATERAKEMAKEQGYPVGRRQMRELKMRVTEELRGRALTRKTVTHAWIDPANGWLVVNASSEGKAEDLVETLRNTLGSLQVTLLETERSPSAALTAWLMLGDAPLTFTIDDELELQAADQSKPTIRYVRHPLDGKEIRAQINSGMYATRMGLTWKDRVAFVLSEKLHVKKVEFLLIEKDKAEEGAEANAAEQFDIEFTLMTGELAALLKDLAVALGAPEQKQAAAA